MVAVISDADSIQPQNPNKTLTKRPPLLPSEKDNGSVVARRPKSKQVSSRYLSPSPSTSTSTSTTTTTNTTVSSCSSSSRRCPSPLLSRSTVSTPVASRPNRSLSVDRRRPVTPRPMTPVLESRQGNAGEISSAAKMLITSTRSLSVSFQGESFSLPISKTKTPSVSNVRKVTPERRRQSPVRGKGDGGGGGGGGDQGENLKRVDQHRWPARIRQSSSHILSRSMDCTDDKKKLCGNGSEMMVRALHRSAINDTRRASGNAELLNIVPQNQDVSSGNESSVPCDHPASDTDSVSSGSTLGTQDCGGVAKGQSAPRGISVSAKFWQETNSRLRQLHNPDSPLSTSPVSRMATPAKFAQSRKFTIDSPSSSPLSLASPVRGAARPASPGKLWISSASSPLRGNPSPSRVKNSANVPSNNNFSNTPSILSFSVDIRRGKVGENRVIDAHILRLLHNRYLQWRFVNARADATFRVQRLNAKKSLWNAWVTISELQHSVTLKRIKLLLLRKKLKLTSILKGQMTYLEEWALLDRDHSNSLLGATEALKASTLRLPVVGKTIADIQNLKDAINSAVDVMHAMASTVCSLCSKVGDLNSLVTELANVTAKERMLLDQCTEVLSSLAALQVKDCSLRTHIIQLNR